MDLKEFAANLLPKELYERWRLVQKSNPLYGGPCFHPELFRVMGDLLPEVKVAVSETEGCFGFLPYQVDTKNNLIGPVPACDYQAMIQPTGVTTNVMQILERLGYVAWDFESLIAEQIIPEPSHVSKENFSRKISIPNGYEAYLQELKGTGKSGKNLATKRRLLERDVGPIRFVTHSTDQALLELIYKWKTQRFEGVDQPLRNAIERILKTEVEGFRGYLSALYAKDTVVAVHFGMQGDGILFYWFPVFNPEMGKYSPGGLLLQELCAHLQEFQSHTLDLGPGGEIYKDYFCNTKAALLSGSYERSAPSMMVRQFKREVLHAVRSNRLFYGAAKTVAKTARGLKGK